MNADIPEEVAKLLSLRKKARKAKNWATSDSLRASLLKLGWIVSDLKGQQVCACAAVLQWVCGFGVHVCVCVHARVCVCTRECVCVRKGVTPQVCYHGDDASIHKVRGTSSMHRRQH